MLLDDKGNPMVSEEEKSAKDRQAEIRRIYADMMNEIAPKTEAEQQEFWKQFVMRIFKNEFVKRKYDADTGYGGLFAKNYKERTGNKHKDLIEQGGARKVASIPPELVLIAKKIYGPDVLKDKQLFRKAFVEDEVGKNCLTVDPKSL